MHPARMEGDDEHAICVPDTPLRNLRSFLGSSTPGIAGVILEVPYGCVRMYDDYNPTMGDWIAMLSISTRLIS